MLDNGPHLSPWDVLSLGTFCLGMFCLGTFCLGTFCMCIKLLGHVKRLLEYETSLVKTIFCLLEHKILSFNYSDMTLSIGIYQFEYYSFFFQCLNSAAGFENCPQPWILPDRSHHLSRHQQWWWWC